MSCLHAGIKHSLSPLWTGGVALSVEGILGIWISSSAVIFHMDIAINLCDAEDRKLNTNCAPKQSIWKNSTYYWKNAPHTACLGKKSYFVVSGVFHSYLCQCLPRKKKIKILVGFLRRSWSQPAIRNNHVIPESKHSKKKCEVEWLLCLALVMSAQGWI